MAFDRKLFAALWRQLDKVAEPHETALHEIREAQGLLCETTDGREPIAWCEDCQMPFFEDDQYATSEDGISVCYQQTDRPEIGPCYDPERKAD